MAGEGLALGMELGYVLSAAVLLGFPMELMLLIAQWRGSVIPPIEESAIPLFEMPLPTYSQMPPLTSIFPTCVASGGKTLFNLARFHHLQA